MHITDFDFDLPTELIAQEPCLIRDQARLLKFERKTKQHTHHRVVELPQLLSQGDLLVVNDTRVYPARLLGHRVPTGGMVECFLLSRLDGDHWNALVHPGQKLKIGAQAVFAGGGYQLFLEVIDRHFHGRRTVSLKSEGNIDVEEVIDAIGHVPLPPYIKRAVNKKDQERYQTVYACKRGSVAAPTAGLHFTTDLLEALDANNIERVAITLHVGYGTFQPIRSEKIEQHSIEKEQFEITKVTADRINTAINTGRRIIAVGTTTARVLETAFDRGAGRLKAGSGVTDLYIYPGFDFQVINALFTNFHLPRSSLFILVSAFAGREQLLAVYKEAISHRYQFYSYGDAMLIT